MWRYWINLLSLILIVIVQVQTGWEKNMFHQLMTNLTRQFNRKDCWLCSHGPSSHRQGWPVMPTATLSLIGWNFTKVSHISDIFPNQFPIIRDPGQFLLRAGNVPSAPLCVRRYKKDPMKKIVNDGVKHVMTRVLLGAYPNCAQVINILENTNETCSKLNPHHATLDGLECNSFDTRMLLYNMTKSLNVLWSLQRQAINPYEEQLYGLPDGLYWMCGRWAGKVLPAVWKGTCTIGTLMTFAWHKLKRSYDKNLGYDPDDTYLSEGARFGAIVLPSLGVAWNVKQLRRISAQLEQFANLTAKDLTSMQQEIESLAGVTAQHKLALDYLLSKEGGLCVWLNTTCCHYVNKTGEIETDVGKLHQIVETIRKSYTPGDSNWHSWLTSWLPDFGWLKSLFVGFLLVVLLFLCLLILECLFCLCLQKYIGRTGRA
uniref:Uncharacterized protein n=1 Tax=Anolis carolinensis TaxID=28377 RepID=A0A803SUG4_ANOCA